MIQGKQDFDPPTQPCLINSLPIVQTKGEGVKGFFKKTVELVKSVSLIQGQTNVKICKIGIKLT